jgi:hypothetical protein
MTEEKLTVNFHNLMIAPIGGIKLCIRYKKNG